MKPVKFKGNNCTFYANDCGDLPAKVNYYKDDTGRITGKSIISAWMPTAEELKALNEGKPLFLEVIGGQPPVSLYVNN